MLAKMHHIPSQISTPLHIQISHLLQADESNEDYTHTNSNLRMLLVLARASMWASPPPTRFFFSSTSLSAAPHPTGLSAGGCHMSWGLSAVRASRARHALSWLGSPSCPVLAARHICIIALVPGAWTAIYRRGAQSRWSVLGLAPRLWAAGLAGLRWAVGVARRSCGLAPARAGGAADVVVSLRRISESRKGRIFDCNKNSAPKPNSALRGACVEARGDARRRSGLSVS